jgi:AmmeMemoRadiSam system protein B
LYQTVRHPSQAGTFYESSKDGLRKQIEGCFLHKFGPGTLPIGVKKPLSDLIAIVSPHAGYVFSGPVAAHGYHYAAMRGYPDSVVILGPNHTGLGSGISIMTRGRWRTPLGDVEIDEGLAKKIQAASNLIDVDSEAHRFEHSIEVQLPFLQYIYPERLKFVPVCMMFQDLQTSREVGDAIANASFNMNVLIVASTDLTHYEPQRIAEAKDRIVIDAIMRLDEEELHKVIEEKNISMCGYGPVSALLFAAKRMGAKKAQLLCYRTSGDITQDHSQVVGYSSLAICRT